MKVLFSLIICCLVSYCSIAQVEQKDSIATEKISTDQDDIIFTAVAWDPEFKGGESALLKYLSSHIEYPKEAIQQKVEGIVYVNFVVRKDGSIDRTKIVKDIGMGCGEEAVRVIKGMPKWIPGKNNNSKPVNVEYTLPVQFNLDTK